MRTQELVAEYDRLALEQVKIRLGLAYADRVDPGCWEVRALAGLHSKKQAIRAELKERGVDV